MKKFLLLAPGLALAAGCGGPSTEIQPGQWETTIQFSSIEIPGMPPEAAAQMQQMISQPQTSSQCITPEEAANPGGRMVAPDGEQNCEFAESTFAGGVIRVRGTCTHPGQGTAQMSMEGSYTATTMEAQISSEVQPPAGEGPQSMRMTGTLNARRTGECSDA